MGDRHLNFHETRDNLRGEGVSAHLLAYSLLAVGRVIVELVNPSSAYTTCGRSAGRVARPLANERCGGPV